MSRIERRQPLRPSVNNMAWRRAFGGVCVMPDKQGRLTLKDKQTIQKWLIEKEANRGCPACGFNQWTIGDILILGHKYTAGGVALGAGYPSAVVFCQRCTFMRWHCAVAIGLVEGGDPSPAENKPEQEAVKHGA